MARRLIGRLVLAIVIVILMPVALLPVYSKINPPITTVMIAKRVAGASIIKAWQPIAAISPHLVRAVIVAEDARFCAHSGIDWRQVEEVLLDPEDGGPLRGASTITMQTVKNLFLWSGRSWLRKGLEVPLALYAEAVLSKRRIMEIYLNVAEWDKGIYGAQAAARHYFGVSAAHLSAAQAARMAATLPAPLLRNPARPSRAVGRLAGLYARRAEVSGPYVACVLN
ncbi:MAG: monofunctional biosynthetic peptidoglycan transglycosylase [Hyphomicrobiales bacterium]|nr:monofunctional biosynthetic peptidoglycan transglycosylase [Hyphomicrobiales bacterium]